MSVSNRVSFDSSRELPVEAVSGSVRGSLRLAYPGIRFCFKYTEPRNRDDFWTVYALGLRMSEGVALQVGDIDTERMLVDVLSLLMRNIVEPQSRRGRRVPAGHLAFPPCELWCARQSLAGRLK